MRNIDRIKALEVKEFVQFLGKNRDGEAWYDWFDKKYCQKCEVMTGEEEDGKAIDFYLCDTTDGCPHNKDKDTLELWLEAECEQE